MKITEKEYIAALSAYFHYTKKLIPMASDEYSKNVRIILHYEGANKKPDNSEILAIWFMLLLQTIISSLLLAALIIWSANEVFNQSVNYSFKNMLILAGIFFFGKIQTRVQVPGVRSVVKRSVLFAKND